MKERMNDPIELEPQTRFAPEPIRNEIGKTLKRLREERGLTVEAVAARLPDKLRGELWAVEMMEAAPNPVLSTLDDYARALDAEVIITIRPTQESLRKEHKRLLDRLAAVESQIEGLE